MYLNWDVEEYYRVRVKGGGDKKGKKFPNPQLGSFSEPMTVVDVKGRIVLWYLPGLLSAKEEVKFFVLFGLKDRADQRKPGWGLSSHSQYRPLVKAFRENGENQQACS